MPLRIRVLLLHDGCIHQEGTPQELFMHPASAWAAEFLGAGNIVPGVVDGKKLSRQWVIVDLPGPTYTGRARPLTC